MSSSASPRHVVLLVAATACWGCGTVLSKHVLDRGVAPLSLLVIELAASCLLLLALMFVLRIPRTRGPALLKLASLGVLNPGLAYALGLLGLASVSASMSVLLWATEPVLIMLLVVLVMRERIPAATATAVAAALVGVSLVIYRPGAAGDALGISLTVAAVTACACYTVLTQRLLLDDSALSVVLPQQAVALTFALAVAGTAAATGVGAIGLPDRASTWGLAIASGAVYYGLAFWFFVGGLRGVSSPTAGAFLPLIPVFGLTAGALTGDQFLDRQWLGAGLVVLATTAAVTHQLSARRGSVRPGCRRGPHGARTPGSGGCG